MTDAEDADVVVEALPAEEAFDLFSHETRLGILRALDAAGPLPFEDLRREVDVSDSGQFNYHLDRLVGQFVYAPGDGDDDGDGSEDATAGYDLTPAGHRVVGAVLSGGYTKALDAAPVEMEVDCFHCGSGLVTRFREDGVHVGCPECGLTWTDASVPAGVFEEWSREAVPGVVARWLASKQEVADRGFCYNCDGRLDVTVEPYDRASAPDWADVDDELPGATLGYDCRRCGHEWNTAPEVAALHHPAAVAFYHDRGVNLRETAIWELGWTFGAAVTAEEPLRVRVPLPAPDGDERLVLVFDDAFDLVEERVE